MSVLQYILSLQGPRGEQRGKALSGADFVCAVANPSTPTKKQSERVAFFLFNISPIFCKITIKIELRICSSPLISVYL